MKRYLAILIVVFLQSVYGNFDKGCKTMTITTLTNVLNLVLVYGTLDSTRPYGFGFYNSTWSPFTTSPLKRQVASLRLANHAVDSTHPEMSSIYAFGDIQFYGDLPVGGLIKYNVISTLLFLLLIRLDSKQFDYLFWKRRLL